MELDVAGSGPALVPRQVGDVQLVVGELTTLDDGTEIGLMMAGKNPRTGKLGANLMVAPEGREDHVGWVEVGSLIALRSGILTVASITLRGLDGPSLVLTRARPSA